MSKRGISPIEAKRVRIRLGINKETRLQRVRINKNLSQSELSDRSGVPVKTIQRYEQNTEIINGAKLKTLVALCRALSCKIGDIIESDELLRKYRSVK